MQSQCALVSQKSHASALGAGPVVGQGALHDDPRHRRKHRQPSSRRWRGRWWGRRRGGGGPRGLFRAHGLLRVVLKVNQAAVNQMQETELPRLPGRSSRKASAALPLNRHCFLLSSALIIVRLISHGSGQVAHKYRGSKQEVEAAHSAKGQACPCTPNSSNRGACR